MRLISKRICILLIVITCSLMLLTPALAATSQEGPKLFAPQQLGKIQLGNGSYTEIVNANIIPTERGNTLALTMLMYNGGSSDLNLVDYWIKVKSKVKSGASYSVKLLPSDKDKDRIPAKSSGTVTYYSQVSSDMKIEDVIVEVVKWDFSQLNFERKLGEIKLSSGTFLVPVNQKYNIEFSGLQIGTYLESAVISKNEKYYNATFKYTLSNNGKSSMNLPQLQYYILTSEGILYSLTTNNEQNINIAPKMSKEISLRGNIPIEIKEIGWRLVVAQPLNETKEVIPIATYSIPKSTQETGSDFGKEYTFTTNDGLYYVQVKTINRTPLEDQDIVTANLTITNKGNTSLPMPKLGGKFVLDGSIDTEAQVIQPDKVIAIKPNSKVNLYLYSLIPYTFDFNNFKLVLQESSQGTEDKSTLLEVSGKDAISGLDVITLGNEYKIDNIGSSSKLKVREVRTYAGHTAKKYVVQINVNNLEKRATSVTGFSGYIQLLDGNIFQGQVTDLKDKMAPGGMALLEISAIIPASYDMNGATMVIGETATVTGDPAKQDTTLVAYVNPIEIQLPRESVEQDHLSEIDLYPYSLSINNVKSQIQYYSGELKVEFNYKLEKSSLVVFNNEKKKIILEVLDEKNNISLSSEYSIEGTDNNDSSFLLGEHAGVLKITDPELVYKLERMNNKYKLNVYEQFEGSYKKLLASKEIQWFGSSD